jgi:hypothetical protein
MHGAAPGRLWKTSRVDHAYGSKKGIGLGVKVVLLWRAGQHITLIKIQVTGVSPLLCSRLRGLCTLALPLAARAVPPRLHCRRLPHTVEGIPHRLDPDL